MKEEVRAPKCGRENELMAFLYGEVASGETADFQRHMRECEECRTEVEGLQLVRGSVVSWRNESLGGISPSPVVAKPHIAIPGERRPSAAAALREFFALSPLWLKGAVACASLLLCMFAGLAITRLRQKPPAPVAANSEYSERQIKAMIDQRVQEELRRIESSQIQQASAPPVVGDAPLQKPLVQTVKRSTEVAREFSTQRARRPLTKTEREQLATDLRLVAVRNDSELDLLDDRINQ